MLERQLLRLFNWLRDKETVPADWQKAMIVNLYKEGDRRDPVNYRGIALISCLGKLYLSMWARRLSQHAEGTLDQSQGGFRPGRNTIDQCLTLSEVLLRRKRQGLDSYMCSGRLSTQSPACGNASGTLVFAVRHGV